MDFKTLGLAAAAVVGLGAAAMAAYAAITRTADAAALDAAVAETEQRQGEVSYPGLELVLLCRKHHFDINAATRYPVATLVAFRAALEAYDASRGFASPAPVLRLLGELRQTAGHDATTTRRPWLYLTTSCALYGLTIDQDARYTTASLQALDAALARHSEVRSAETKAAMIAAFSALTTEAAFCASLS